MVRVKFTTRTIIGVASYGALGSVPPGIPATIFQLMLEPHKVCKSQLHPHAFSIALKTCERESPERGSIAIREHSNRSRFGRGSAPGPSGERTTLPLNSSRAGEG